MQYRTSQKLLLEDDLTMQKTYTSNSILLKHNWTTLFFKS